MLGVDIVETAHTLYESPHFRLFEFDNWADRQHFVKQFLSGVFVPIVMTGLDQDMMQKNLSCRNLKEAQKNMYVYGFLFIPINFMFLCLGILLITLASQRVQFKLSHCPKSITYARIKKIISNDKGRIFSHGVRSIRGNRIPQSEGQFL
jgi:Na+/proline symporter